ncbi:MAG: TraR/DksA family transcriptional regulator [Nitrospinae bacterium]|nr:TraR/DksA family transcriptional regulator [Nitrospinota bacterium]
MAPPKALDPALLKIKEKLMASRQELFRMIESSQEMERNVNDLTFSNEIDLASSLEGREMVFQLASRDRNELKMINDALFKMAKGTYGICESCSKPIGTKRLQIMPLTKFCIDCQESMETPA